MCIKELSGYERLSNKESILTSKELIKLAMGIENIKDLEEIDDINNIGKPALKYIDKNDRAIFHYTSGEGLKGIIENKEIWFSKADFLNDVTELKHTYDLIHYIIKGTKLKVRNDDKLFNEVEEFDRYLDKLLFEEAKNFNIVDTYSASFSMNGDSNLLWEGYSKDDGYNIEFRSKDLFKVIDKNINSDALLYPCMSFLVIYDEEKQIELLKDEVKTIYKIFKYCKKFNKLNEFKKLADTNKFNILRYSFMFKSKEFEQEQEYRIIIVCVGDEGGRNDGFNVRVRKGAFIPYYKASISYNDNEIPVKSITIGPKNNLDITKNGVEHLLKFNNVKGINDSAHYENNIEIKKSEIPYRY